MCGSICVCVCRLIVQRRKKVEEAEERWRQMGCSSARRFSLLLCACSVSSLACPPESWLSVANRLHFLCFPARTNTQSGQLHMVPHHVCYTLTSTRTHYPTPLQQRQPPFRSVLLLLQTPAAYASPPPCQHLRLRDPSPPRSTTRPQRPPSPPSSQRPGRRRPGPRLPHPDGGPPPRCWTCQCPLDPS
jgi:hypothetical protein